MIYDNGNISANNISANAGGKLCIGSTCITESELSILKNNVVPRMSDPNSILIGVSAPGSPYIRTNLDRFIVIGSDAFGMACYSNWHTP